MNTNAFRTLQNWERKTGFWQIAGGSGGGLLEALGQSPALDPHGSPRLPPDCSLPLPLVLRDQSLVLGLLALCSPWPVHDVVPP